MRSNLNFLYIKWLYTGGLRAAADESEITAYLFAKQKSIKRSISALSLHQLSKIIKKATLEGSYLYPSCQLISYSRLTCFNPDGDAVSSLFTGVLRGFNKWERSQNCLNPEEDLIPELEKACLNLASSVFATRVQSGPEAEPKFKIWAVVWMSHHESKLQILANRLF